MAEQRNKITIDLKVNSDVTKQLEKIRKTSQASSENLSADWVKILSDWFKENLKDVFDSIRDYLKKNLKQDPKIPENLRNMTKKPWRKGGHLESGFKDLIDLMNEQLGHGGPFYVDEIKAHMKEMGHGKHIDKYLEKIYDDAVDDGTDGFPSLMPQIKRISSAFDEGAGPGLPFEWMSESIEKLEKPTRSLVPQFNNLSSSYRDQTKQIQSLLPAMKQAGAGLKGMEGMLTSFASKSGPALENFLGGLMRGKGGLTESLLAA
jgi:hypothetical protein